MSWSGVNESNRADFDPLPPSAALLSPPSRGRAAEGGRGSETAPSVTLQIVVVVTLLLLPFSASAQQRPLLTEDPRVIPDGSVVTELGLGYSRGARFPISGLEGDQYSLLANGLHISLGSRAEFQMGGVVHHVVRVRENGTGWRNDWGDFSLSTKMVVAREGRRRPIISFRPTIVLPNSNRRKELGADGTNFFASLLVGKTFGRIFLFGNGGLGVLDDTVNAALQQDVLTYGIAALARLNSRTSAAAEWNGLFNPLDNPSPGAEDRGQVRLGLQIQAAGGRWDIAGTAGTTPWDHRLGLVFGFTKEFQVWR